MLKVKEDWTLNKLTDGLTPSNLKSNLKNIERWQNVKILLIIALVINVWIRNWISFKPFLSLNDNV